MLRQRSYRSERPTLHNQRPAPPASTREHPQAAARTQRGQKIEDAQGGFCEEADHGCGCYPGLNLRACPTLLLVPGLHVRTQQSPVWVTSVAVVFDASSGLLASKPCGPAHAWEQIPLAFPATRVSHLHGNWSAQQLRRACLLPWGRTLVGDHHVGCGPGVRCARGREGDIIPFLGEACHQAWAHCQTHRGADTVAPAFEKESLLPS